MHLSCAKRTRVSKKKSKSCATLKRNSKNMDKNE